MALLHHFDLSCNNIRVPVFVGPTVWTDKFDPNCVLTWFPASKQKRFTRIEPLHFLIVNNIANTKITAISFKLGVLHSKQDRHFFTHSKSLAVFQIENDERLRWIST